MGQVCSRQCFCVVTIALASAHAQHFGALAADDSEVMLEVLRQGYLANRDAFRSFSCRFTVVGGGVTSLDDAIRGDIANAVVRHGLWIVDGAKQRYELRCENRKADRVPQLSSDDAKKDGPLAKSGECATEVKLSEGSLGLVYTPAMMSANIGGRWGTTPGILYTPLSMGVMGDDENMGPGRAQVMGLRAPAYRRYKGIRDVDGTEVHVLAVGEEGDETTQWCTEWYLDPQRGFLPIEVWLYDSPTVVQGRTVVTRVRRCPNGAFFPEQSVTIWNPDWAPPVRACVIELTELSLDRPEEEDFRIRLAPGTSIVKPPTMLANVTLKKSEDIHLDDLNAWISRCEDALRVKMEVRAGNPSRIPRHRGVRIFLVGNIVLLVVVAVVCFWRLRVRRRR